MTPNGVDFSFLFFLFLSYAFSRQVPCMLLCIECLYNKSVLSVPETTHVAGQHCVAYICSQLALAL